MIGRFIRQIGSHVEDKLVLNISAVINGGAGNYALQNHRLLLELGYNSYLIVKTNPEKVIEKVITYPDSKWKKIIPKISRMVWKFVLSYYQFDDKYLFYNKLERINCYSATSILKQLPRNPDIIFIYWVSGFVNARLIRQLSEKTKAKIYILLIDNAPLTGGCHYPWDCEGYVKGCKSCPAVQNKMIRRLVKANLDFKMKHLPDGITLIAPTQTDYLRAKKSYLFRNNKCIKITEVVDNVRFKPPVTKKKMSDYFEIPGDKKIVLIGASFLNERRKGMKELMQALNYIKSENIFLLIAGNTDFGPFQIEHKKLGYLNEDELIKAYQSAYIFVCPSLEDSGPLMVNQSIMCGTPVVAFNMGSASDLVKTGETGYLAQYADILDLAKGIDYMISLDDIKYSEISQKCRSLGLNVFCTSVYKKHIEELF